jgi:mannose-6-phosphate isomerase-like protein (cupin superfamily)
MWTTGRATLGPVRQIITGIDGGGRSCVVTEFVNPPTGPAVSARAVFETASNPAPPRPPGQANAIDLRVPVGIARWLVVQWPPGLTSRMHHTDTVDFDMVLEGSIDLVLDDGPHRLEVGDCAVVTGVDHGWESGPSGCTTAVLLLGTPPPE